MPVQTLTDATFARRTRRPPALILLSNGTDKLRGDFKTAFNKAADEDDDGILFAQVDPAANPGLRERFDYQRAALLIGSYRGETLVRRSRPWASDLPDFIQQLRDARDAHEPPPPAPPAQRKPKALSKPLNVTDATFEKEVIAASHDLPALVDFWAEWCGPCRQVAPILEKLAMEYAGQIRIAKVDTDANPGLSQAFQIRSIPTIAMFKGGQLIFMQPGALPEASFRELITQALALDAPAPAG